MLDELDNAVRYFAAHVRHVSVPDVRRRVSPVPVRAGLSVAADAAAGRSGRERPRYAFIAHETAHQWWGNIVAWRSYRDQWLSEGFAEYSGMLYAAKRDKKTRHRCAS